MILVFMGKKPLKYPRFQGGSDPVTNVLATLQSHIYIYIYNYCWLNKNTCCLLVVKYNRC